MPKKPKRRESSWLITSVLILVILLFSASSYLLLDNTVRHYVEERLTTLVQASRHGVRKWVSSHELIMGHVVRQPELVSSLERLADTDCVTACRESATAGIRQVLVSVSQLFADGDKAVPPYHSDAYILSVDHEILASSGQLTDEGQTGLIGLLRQEEPQIEGFRMPRRPPVGFDSNSRLFEPMVLFILNVPGFEGNQRKTLVVTLRAREAFSELVAGTTVSGRKVTSPAGDRNPVVEDSYAFNQQGVLITMPTQSRKLVDSHLVNSDQLILNVSLRDPGGDLMSGYHPAAARDDQPYTRLALSAMVGESGVDTTGYRNYLGVSVFGAWLWDEQLDMGFAAEIEESTALLVARRAQLFIVLLGLIASLGLIWLRYQSIGDQRAIEEETESSKQQLEIQLSELKLTLDTAVQRQESGQLELQAEVGERKKLFDQSRSAIELHRSLMDISQDGILIVKQGNQLVDFNGCFIQMWDLDLNVKQGAARDLEQIVHRGMAVQLAKPVDGLNILNDWLPGGDPGEPHEVAEILSLKNGRKLRLLSLPLLAEEEGEQGVHGRLLIFRNVDENMEPNLPLDNMTVDLQKLLCVEILARGVSHEFNNILAAVFGYTELVQRFVDPESDVAEYVSELLDAARRVQVVVQNFLSFSRQPGQEQEWVGIEVQVDLVLRLMAEVMPLGITITREFPTEDIQVHVCSQRISQALLITLFESVKRLPSGGELHICCAEPAADRVSIEIWETPLPEDAGSKSRQKRAILDIFSGIDEHFDAISELMLEEGGTFEIIKGKEGREIRTLSFSTSSIQV